MLRTLFRIISTHSFSLGVECRLGNHAMVMMSCFSAQSLGRQASELQRGKGHALRQAFGRCIQEINVLDSVCFMQLYHSLHAHVMCT